MIHKLIQWLIKEEKLTNRLCATTLSQLFQKNLGEAGFMREWKLKIVSIVCVPLVYVCVSIEFSKKCWEHKNWVNRLCFISALNPPFLP